MSTTQSELRLASLLDERETVTKLHETVIASVETNEDKLPTESQSQMIRGYREKEIALDEEIQTLTEDVERNRRAIESSKSIRRVLTGGSTNGFEATEDGVSYRTMAAYARDVILTEPGRTCSKIAAQFGEPTEIQRAKERLQLAQRTPDNTLSSDVTGLQPAQHIAQIFQVIDKSRPIVTAAGRTTLERGTLTYPKVTSRPVVAVQASEKTEAGNTGMVIDMETATASTYLGGGDLSWQAINWSTPDALQLWFDMAAADYALKTESDAGKVILDDAFVNVIADDLDSTPAFEDLMTAIGEGYAEVYANSNRIANTVLMSPDRYAMLIGLTSTPMPIFTSVSGNNIGPLNIIVSRGLDEGVIIVGDMGGLLVAETANAPVELRVVEPAIGGLEVGLIGAFEAVIVDPGSFSLLTTAS